MEEQKHDFGPRPELQWIEPEFFTVDDTYQRSIDTPKSAASITNIVRNFHWSGFGALTVADAGDGTYQVLDGQHRAAAAMVLGLSQVPCVVVVAVGTSDQADAFVSINRDRVQMQPVEIYHASVASGDVEALALRDVLSECGITVPRTPRSSGSLKPEETQSVAALQKILSEFGREHLVSILTLLRSAYPETPGVTSFLLNTGLNIVAALASTEVDIDRDRLAKAMGTRSPSDWHDVAKAHANDLRCKPFIAARILIFREYNKGKRNDVLPLDW